MIGNDQSLNNQCGMYKVYGINNTVFHIRREFFFHLDTGTS